jgi:hypothetical protein
MKNVKNKIYTLSYFIKRLIDSGLYIETLLKYDENDVRRWTILINPNKEKILCTCVKITATNYFFLFVVNSENIIKVRTESMAVIIETLQNFLINNTDKSKKENNVDVVISTSQSTLQPEERIIKRHRITDNQQCPVRDLHVGL